MTDREVKEIDEKKVLLKLWSGLEGDKLIINDEEKARIMIYRAYEKIIEFNGDFMDLPDETHKLIAMWVVSTYFHNSFETFPYLFLNAMKGSGKTRQLKIISNLANKGDGTIQNSMTESVLFRWDRNKILCIDEAENISSKEKQALRQILNASYKKGVKITRMKKVKTLSGSESFEPEHHEPFMPICMANISGMDEVLGDRSIQVVLEKSNDPRITKKAENFSQNEQIDVIKSILNQFSVVYVMYSSQNYINKWNKYLNTKYYTTTYTTNTTLQYTTTLKQELEEEELEFFNKLDEAGINGRNFELCFPLLFTAKSISEDLFMEILKILKEIVKSKQEDDFMDSRDNAFFDLISKKDSWRFQWIKVRDITIEFKQYMGEQDALDERWLNDRWVGLALKRLKLNKAKKRMPKGVEVQLDIDKAKEMVKKFK